MQCYRLHANQLHSSVPKGGVVVLGNFDGVHLGHQFVLQQARKIAQSLSTTLQVASFYPHPRQALGESNLFILDNFATKMYKLNQQGVDALLLLRFNSTLRQLSALNFLTWLNATLQPKVMVVGEDFQFGFNREGSIQLLREWGATKGIQIHTLALQEFATSPTQPKVISSSLIREFIVNKDIAMANKLLGSTYGCIGKVIHGDKLAHQLGFPTINMILPKNSNLPFGVYVSQVLIDGCWYKGVTNVGQKPTFKQNTQPLIETHIFNFSDYIYGKKIFVCFYSYIRQTKKFPSIDELTETIKSDIVKAKLFFN